MEGIGDIFTVTLRFFAMKLQFCVACFQDDPNVYGKHFF